MNYQEALNRIHSLDKFGTRLGLERVKELLQLLGEPQKNLKFIHVAGTNGKGSTSEMLSEIFRLEYKNVGLYTSPFVIDFRERMQINGDMISEQELAGVATEVFKAADTMEDFPTEFEVVSAIAFLWFSIKKCDLVVLEVGLGGKYDATNVIEKPLASVITSVSFDHMQYLGNTLAEIAYNKAGIIKEGSKTVIACSQSEEARRVLIDEAQRRHNEILLCRNESKSYNGKSFIYKDKLYELSMLGAHQVENAITAIETANLIGAKSINIRKGIKNAVLPARMEILSTSPLVILDGAHNVGGIEMLCRNLRRFFGTKNIIAVTAMMRDKQWQESVLKLEEVCGGIIATQASNPRSLSAKELGEFLHCEYTENPREAFGKAIAKSGDNSLILVCGSFYLAGDVREFIIRATK